MSLFDSGRFGSAIVEDMRRGSRAGVIGTPAFFLNVTMRGQVFNFQVSSGCGDPHGR